MITTQITPPPKEASAHPSAISPRAISPARRPLRVLHLLDRLSPGGAERHLVNVLRVLPRKEHAVCFLRPPQDLVAELVAEGVPVQCLDFHRSLDLGPVVLRLCDELRMGNYQLIFTQTWLADMVGRMAGVLSGVPVISAVQTSAYEPETLATYSLAGRLKARLFHQPLDIATGRFLRRFIAVSHHVEIQTAKRLRVAKERISLVPNSVGTAYFHPPRREERASARAHFALGQNTQVLLSIGKLTRGKGMDLLIQALPELVRRVPHAELWLLGQGQDEGRLRRQARALGVSEKVRFVGQKADVRPYLFAADAFVFASRYEGLPLAVLEAMASGLPCLLAQIPPHKEVSANGQGAWLLPHEPSRWSVAMTEMLLRPDLAQRFATIGGNWVREHYNAVSIARRLEAIFQEEAKLDPWVSGPHSLWERLAFFPLVSR